MGDYFVRVVELTLGEDEARERVEGVVDWLLAAGIIERRAEPIKSWELPYKHGPRWSEACREKYDIEKLNTGVSVSWEHGASDSGGAYQPPQCPRCGTALETGTHMKLIGGWWKSRDEPTATCEYCGKQALLGDWTGVFGVLVGRASVHFENWPQLTPAFIADVGGRLGPRWRIVSGKI